MNIPLPHDLAARLSGGGFFGVDNPAINSWAASADGWYVRADPHIIEVSHEGRLVRSFTDVPPTVFVDPRKVRDRAGLADLLVSRPELLDPVLSLVFANEHGDAVARHFVSVLSRVPTEMQPIAVLGRAILGSDSALSAAAARHAGRAQIASLIPFLFSKLRGRRPGWQDAAGPLVAMGDSLSVPEADELRAVIRQSLAAKNDKSRRKMQLVVAKVTRELAELDPELARLRVNPALRAFDPNHPRRGPRDKVLADNAATLKADREAVRHLRPGQTVPAQVIEVHDKHGVVILRLPDGMTGLLDQRGAIQYRQEVGHGLAVGDVVDLEISEIDHILGRVHLSYPPEITS